MKNFETNYEIQDIAMKLIMAGYSDAERALNKARAIYAGMKVINNLNEAAAKEAGKCQVYKRERKLVSYESIGNLTCNRTYEVVITDSSSIRAERLLKLKDVEWKMMKNVAGLNEFQILEVA